MKKILLSPDPPLAGDPGDSKTVPAPKIDPPNPPTPAPSSDAAAPPAAAVVLNAERNEREIALNEELQRERQEKEQLANDKKAREMKIAELEDQITSLTAPPPRKKEEHSGRWRPFKL